MSKLKNHGIPISTETVPKDWVIVKIDDVYKVFGTWLWGEWKLNSGIKSIEIDGDYFMFHGYSGSIYRCHKMNYGVSNHSALSLDDIARLARDEGCSFDILKFEDVPDKIEI